MRGHIALTLFVVLFVAVIGIDTYYHEQAHSQIMYEFGCKEVTITYSFTGGMTNCTGGYYDRPVEWVTKERELHSLNEIVGYNLEGVICLGLMMCGFYLLLTKVE